MQSMFSGKRFYTGLLLAAAVVLILALSMAGCGSDEDDTTVTGDAATDTGTTESSLEDIDIVEESVPIEPAAPVEEEPVAAEEAETGPYTTMDAAIGYVESQSELSGAMRLIEPASTWNPSATLHVLHATPSGSASYGGDYYYFFVNGNLVGEESFTHGAPAGTPDDNTLVVEYAISLPTDPHCCPTGGEATVRFQWDGGTLQVLDPMTGATM
jgi:hypothetical protein